MALETLIHLEDQAMDALGMDAEGRKALADYYRPQTTDLGEIEVGDKRLPAEITHVGEGANKFKGGAGEKNGRSSTELGCIMARKVVEWGLTDLTDTLLGGNKIMIEGISKLSVFDQEVAFRGLARRLHMYKLLRNTSAAGDMSTNDPRLMDALVEEAHQVDPEYPYWQIVATGTSPELGGNKYRGQATGRGVAAAARFAREMREEQHGKTKDVLDVSAIGIGNVGGWAVHDLSQDAGYRITALCDIGGTLRLKNPQPGQPGIILTERMVRDIADNPNLSKDTNKLALLKAVIETNQPGLELIIDDSDILAIPADIHLPCAGKETINDTNVHKVAASIIVPGANSPYTLAAWNWLHDPARAAEGKPRTVLTDTLGNGRGVLVSTIELNAKVAAVDQGKDFPSDADIEAEAERKTQAMFRAVGRMAAETGTSLGVASTAVGCARLALKLGVKIDPRFAEIVRRQEVEATATV